MLNLRRTGLVIFRYSLIFTSSDSFLAVAFIPDATRARFSDNLISGIAMHLVGPLWLRLFFQGFVVLVGFLILSGDVTTAIVGSNAVLNRVSEDGVLPEWFRHPHRRFGTSHRTLNVIVGLQLLTVVLSGGDIYLLGEAYAFGVVWSFALKGLAVLVLRYKEPGPREWRVPLNFRLWNTEVPVGLALTTLGLFSVALINLFTKRVATVSGFAFTMVIYVVFVVAEHANAKRRRSAGGVDQFQLAPADDIDLDGVGIRPGGVLVPVRDYNTLAHLKWALGRPETAQRDVAVLTVRLLDRSDTTTHNLQQGDLFSDYEQLLFTRVVAVAEREGRPVKLLVVPATNVFDAVARTTVRLASSEIVLGDSAKFSADNQARLLGEAWERVEGSQQLATRLLAYKLTGEVQHYQLGAHAPGLTRDDLDLIHELWLEMGGTAGDLHHRDIVRAALEEFHMDLKGPRRAEVLARVRGGQSSTPSGEPPRQ